MSFLSICPACDARQQLPNKARGKKAVCPECGVSYPVPHSAGKSAGNLTAAVGFFAVLGILLLMMGVAMLGWVFYSRASRSATPVAVAVPPPTPLPVAQPAPTEPGPAPAPAPDNLLVQPAEKPLTVTSDTLRQQVARDEAAAERQYKDKTVLVTGMIGAIISEPPLRGILFGSLQDPVPPVLCDLAPDQMALAAKLKPGQKVTIRGVYLGKVQGGFVGLSKCQLVTR